MLLTRRADGTPGPFSHLGRRGRGVRSGGGWMWGKRMIEVRGGDEPDVVARLVAGHLEVGEGDGVAARDGG